MVSRTTIRRNALLAVLLVMVIALLGPFACPPTLYAHDADSVHPSPSIVPPPPVPLALSMDPGPDAQNVDPLASVIVSATAGSLLTVEMVNEADKAVEGVMTPDNTVWKPTVPLGYGRSYTVTATGRGADA